MQKSAVVALAILESAAAFQAPAMKASTKAVGATMFSEGDVGVLPPLGVYDPLGLIGTKDMTRFEIMEIKHGRAAMLGFVHVILLHAGARFPGYISPSAGLKFADIPSGCFASLEALPTAGWLQIMAVTCMMETGAQARFARRPTITHLSTNAEHRMRGRLPYLSRGILPATSGFGTHSVPCAWL